MEFEDVTPIMLLGEARVIAAGKLLVSVGSQAGLASRSAPDIALVILDSAKKPLGHGPVVSSSTPSRKDRSTRHLYDIVLDGRWHASVFELSTILVPAEAVAVSIVADGIHVLDGDLIITVEDGMSRPHVFPMRMSKEYVTAVAASVYRHGEEWKVRAYGHAYSSDRATLCSQLGIGDAWPGTARTDITRLAPPEARSRPRLQPNPAPRTAPRPSLSSHPASSPESPPPLDLERLSAIERDTAAVSELLSDIFADVTEAPAVRASPSRPSKLDQPHAAILEVLMADGRIALSDFTLLARKHGLLPSGAVETLNDWGMDVLGDLVITEDADGYAVVSEYLPALKALSSSAASPHRLNPDTSMSRR
jgi:stress response protein SCP2